MARFTREAPRAGGFRSGWRSRGGIRPSLPAQEHRPSLSAQELQTLNESMQMLCKRDQCCSEEVLAPLLVQLVQHLRSGRRSRPQNACMREAPGAPRVQAPPVVPRYVPDGRPPAPPAAWPTALQGSAEALPGVDYAQLAAAVAPQFDDPRTVADARTRALVVIHRVRRAWAQARGTPAVEGTPSLMSGRQGMQTCSCFLDALLVFCAQGSVRTSRLLSRVQMPMACSSYLSADHLFTCES